MHKLSFIEKLIDNCSNYSDEIAVIDVRTGGHITYGKLYHLSGRIYNYLHKNNIGKEDVVMITLPRGTMPLVALLGVWRAGAAFIMLENDYPENKKEFIKQNAECKLVIDSSLFSEMMKCDSLEGYEKADPHNLAYIIYTSGTTGDPKGIMHEFGTLEYCVKALPYEGKDLISHGDRVLLLSPLHFTASLMLIESVIFTCSTIVILPLESARNIERLYSVMSDYGITVGFLTPSLLKLIPRFPSSMKKIITGAEPVNNIYYDNIEVYGKYAQSESGYSVLNCLLDRNYDIAFAGKATIEEAEVCIINEKGDIVNDGEICFKNPYFRGYLRLPDKNKTLFHNGHVRTGDMGKYLPDGNIVFCGRMDDMVKINGNRVEPAEIEKAVKSVLGVDWAAVRAFNEGGRNYVCAYYIDAPITDIETAKDMLRTRLASYMMPAYFMRIDHIPTNENGKFKRNDLPAPDLNKRRNEYIAPVGDLEQQICEAMQQVLDLERVGACDDFYELGGDSIASIELITFLNWDLLEGTMVYQGRTPRKIAELYTTALENQQQNVEERNHRALSQDQPLSGEQIYMFDYQCYLPHSTVWNLPILLKLDGSVDLDRVKRAVDICLKAHPVFSTVYIFNDDNNLIQRYDQNKSFDIKIEDISEREFVDLTETLVQPYILINQPLYRVRLFRTERGGYLFIDMHHSISDGTSLHILVEDICQAYEGIKPAIDYYYLNLEERRKDRASHLFEEGRKYYSETFDNYEWSTYLNVDVNTTQNIYGNLASMIPIEQRGYDSIQRIYGCGKNTFFIAAAVLALHIYNGKDNIFTSWIYNGRQKSIEQRIIGTLIRCLYVGVRFYTGMKLLDLFKNVGEQVNKGIYYSCYPFVGLNQACEESNDAAVIYQSDLRTLNSVNEMKFTLVDLPGKTDSADNYLDIEIHDTDDGCKLYLDYNASVYTKDSINKFRKLYTKIACSFIEHIGDPDILISSIVKEITTIN